MGWVVLDFDVEHGGQATQPLSPDAGAIGGIHNLKAQLFNSALRTPRPQFVDINRRHEGLLGQYHGFLGGSPNTNAQNAGRAPARPHSRQRVGHPVNDTVGGVQHDQF